MFIFVALTIWKWDDSSAVQ